MSVHPKYAKQIIAGTKKVEFRRRAPRKVVSRMVIYATAPIGRVVGHAQIDEVVTGSLEGLWGAYCTVAGMSQEEFNDYFAGLNEGVALVLSDPTEVKDSTLAARILGDYNPPQSFAYMPAAKLPEARTA